MSPGPSESAAEKIFFEFLARQDAGEEVHFESLCRENLEYANILRVLMKEHEEASAFWKNVKPEINPKRAKDPTKNTSEKAHDLEGIREQPHVFARLSQKRAGPGRYRIVEEIARGGQGVIWRVWDEELRRHLAMKVAIGRRTTSSGSQESFLEDQSLLRFLDEAQVTAQLSHPGIVPIHELGFDSDGHLFFTMRLVKGLDLAEVFRLVHDHESTEWNQTRALGVVVKVCETLAYAHSKGVVHRDLKPANVMVGRFGQVYVMDWGLAKILDPDSMMTPVIDAQKNAGLTILQTDRNEQLEADPSTPLRTIDGDIMGTPCFMPPEQAWGEVEKIDQRSDVYSVGAMLYQLLTGMMPYVYEAKNIPAHTVLKSVKEESPKSVHQLNSQVPAELEAICSKAMARRQEDRYVNIQDLREDLRSYLEGRVVRAYETGAIAELRKWVGRNRRFASVTILAILFLIGSLSVTSALYLKNGGLLIKAERKRYNSNILSAYLSFQAGDAIEAKRRLAACPEDQRHWEWHFAQRRIDLSVRTFRGNKSRIHRVLFVPGNNQVAAIQKNNVHFWSLDSEENSTSLNSGQNSIHDFGFHEPSGHFLLASPRPALEAWSLSNTDSSTSSWRKEAAPNGTVALSKDASTLLLRTPAGSYALASSLSGEIQVLLENSEKLRLPQLRDIPYATFSPDLRWIAIGAESSVKIWSVASGKLTYELGGMTDGALPLCFSPTSDSIAVGWKSTQHIQLKADKPRKILEKSDNWLVSALAFTTDGRLILGGLENGTLAIWDASSGVLQSELSGHDSRATAISVSDNGKWILSGSLEGVVKLWDTEITTIEKVIKSDKEEAQIVAFDTSHRKAAISDFPEPGNLSILDFKSGNVTTLLQSWENEYSQPTFATDSDHLFLLRRDGASVDFWDIEEDGSQGSLYKISAPISSYGVCLRKDLAVTIEKNGKSTLWNTADGERIQSLDLPTSGVSQVAVHPHKDQIVIYSNDGLLYLLNYDTGTEILDSQNAPFEVARLEFSPDGKQISLQSIEQAPQYAIWNVSATKFDGENRKETKPRMSEESWLNPSGDRFVLVNWQYAETKITLWDTTTPETILQARAFFRPIYRVSQAANGSTAIVGWEKGKVLLTDGPPAWEILHSIEQDDYIESFDFSGDNLFLVLNRDQVHEAKLLQHPDWNAIEIEDLGFPFIGKFSPAGDTLAYSALRDCIQIFDTRKRRKTVSLKGHGGPISQMYFPFFHDRIYTAAHDSTIKIWDLETGDFLMTIKTAESPYSIVISPDGSHLFAPFNADPFASDVVPALTIW